MTTERTDRDPALSAAFAAVVLTGALIVVVSGLALGLNTAGGAAVGAVLAALNLWGLARLVQIYLYSDGFQWAAVGFLKMAALFGAVFYLATRDFVGIGALVAGYSALPLGILFSRLKPAPAPPAQEH